MALINQQFQASELTAAEEEEEKERQEAEQVTVFNFLSFLSSIVIISIWLINDQCRSMDQQGDSDSKYIFPFDPYTESDISIPGPFCSSEAHPFSIAVGYIFRDVSP